MSNIPEREIIRQPEALCGNVLQSLCEISCWHPRIHYGKGCGCDSRITGLSEVEGREEQIHCVLQLNTHFPDFNFYKKSRISIPQEIDEMSEITDKA